jgi:hypothetical protein
MTESAAVAAGYTVVANKKAMQRLNTNMETMISGQFGVELFPYEYDGYGGSLPHLSEMTVTALDILDNDVDGFFLMIEGGQIDWAGHSNDIVRNIYETIEFENTVKTVYDWARGKPDTLIIVTADHETGGLTVLHNNGLGNIPDVSWSTSGHTVSNVPIYARGENSQMISGIMDNTDLFSVATSTSFEPTDYYCDNDMDNYVSFAISGSCEGSGCEPVGCVTGAGSDCDDDAGEINPSALENCTDGLDNDCDGLVDDQDPDAVNCTFTCTDGDVDNYASEGGDCGPVDCNDENPAINPGACDIKNDGIDQDCNGKDRTKGRECTSSVNKEVCDDGFDNDGDGKIDCADRKDCRKDPAC